MSDVAVVIVNYLSGDLVEKAVDALAGQFDVHVWDNSGDLPSRVRSLATVHGDGRNLLFARPNNEMYRATSARYVLLLNPDVVIKPEAVKALVGALDADPTAWSAMPRLVGSDGGDQNYLRRLPTLPMMLVDRMPGLRAVWPGLYKHYYCHDVDLTADAIVEQPPAACLLVRRSAVGSELFDENYPLFFNDTDLARRLNALGHCRYLASVSAVHIGGASIQRARRQRPAWIRRQYDMSLLRYARRNVRGGILLAPIVLARVALAELAAATIRVVRGNER